MSLYMTFQCSRQLGPIKQNLTEPLKSKTFLLVPLAMLCETPKKKAILQTQTLWHQTACKIITL